MSHLSPWLESDFACTSTQSLCIISILSQTTEIGHEPLFDQSESPTGISHAKFGEETFIEPIASTLDFGFTIGATKTVMQCIAQITKLAHDIKQGTAPLTMDTDIAKILSRLQAFEYGLQPLDYSAGLFLTPERLECLPNETDIVYHQFKAFIFGTYIYLYRVVFELPPQSLIGFVTPTLENVSAFLGKNGGNFSLWPAFIAAVEAYTEHDMILARQWLEHAVSFGLGNRQLIRKVVERVWEKREEVSKELDIDQGFVSVDWREVMKELDIEVLLI